jgi:predicted CopG family antitoxin
MTTARVPISKDVIARLMRKKRQGETISDVIGRLIGEDEPKEQDIMQFFGRWKDLPEEVFDVFRESGIEIRKEFLKRLESP